MGITTDYLGTRDEDGFQWVLLSGSMALKTGVDPFRSCSTMQYTCQVHVPGTITFKLPESVCEIQKQKTS